jgi:hypothetical protein
LEHRTAKLQYPHTDRREYIKQMTQVECREACIRHIHTRTLDKGEKSTIYEHVAQKPDAHHCIRQSEDSYEHVGLYVMEHNGEPAVKLKVCQSYLIIANRNQDFIPKLKQHLLPCIQSLLGVDNTSDTTQGSGPPSGTSGPGTPVGLAHWPGVLFKHDQMYKHQVMHKNFTSYDVDDARPGKPNKTPKCLFSSTQARGRKRGGLNSYHQRQGMSNANGRDYSWGICNIRYEIGHPKIFRVCETVSLKFGQVRFWLGLDKMVITTRSTSANPTRQ